MDRGAAVRYPDERRGSPPCPNGQLTHPSRWRRVPMCERLPRAQPGSVISAVDDALAALLRRDVLDAARVEVAFDAPNKDWAAKRSGPTVDLFLYDLREDTRRRQHGELTQRDSEGRVIARRAAPRLFALSYLLTAWAQRPEDEHRLLTATLTCLLRYDALPADVLGEDPTGLGMPLSLTAGAPPPEDRSFTDIWSAVGGELRPAIGVTVCVPMVPGVEAPLPPLVREPAVVSLHERSG